MIPFRTFLLGAISLLLPMSSSTSQDPSPSAPITKGQRVFTTGHSFHAFTAKIVDEMAKSAGYTDHKIAGVSSIGASQVVNHWVAGDDHNAMREAIAAGQVDVLTTSPIWLPDIGIGMFARFVAQQHADTRITVQEFWLPNDTYNPVFPYKHSGISHNVATVESLTKAHDLYFHDMDAYVADINKKRGKDIVLIIPAGQAVLALRKKVIAGEIPSIKTQDELFTDTWGHPGEVIRVLASYCQFAVIYRRSPVGLPVPGELKKSKIPAADQSALNLLLQQLAWDAVTRHPMSGVVAAP